MSRFDRIQVDVERKKKEAEERQAAYAKLTIPQKLERLDQLFGPGLGATKQRARYAAALAKGLEEEAKERQLEEKRKAKRETK